MSNTRQILQQLTDAGGSVDKEDLHLATKSQVKALSRLRAFGYVVTEHKITDEGRAHLEQLAKPKPRKLAKQDAAIAAAWSKSTVLEARYPLVLTDEGIAKIRLEALSMPQL